MAVDPQAQAATALSRFAFAPRAGNVARDVRAVLLADLDRPGAGRIVNDDLLTVGEAARAQFSFRQERKAARLAAKAEREATAKADAAPVMQGVQPGMKPDMSRDMNRDMAAKAGNKAGNKPKQQPGVPQQIYFEEAKARYDAALAAETGFVERLVWFWSNHFCVSADKGPVRALCGAFEREAIRPHVTGTFADMLLAVETHPAMLHYLDNVQSMGPDSRAGQRRGKGINENLAREIMELHTVGVRSGYSQADVTNFAKVITGWSIVPVKQEHGGEFMFNPRLHEPGPERVMGREYQDNGFDQGRAVLETLARSPATAKHIATKLVRHFVADEPPPALVALLTRRYLDTGGNLKELARALVTAPQAFDAPRTKLKKPSEWLVDSLRALDIDPPDVRPLIQAQNLLGEPLWRPPAPNGFADDSAAWMDGLPQRLDLANRMSRQARALIDPEAVAERTFGPSMSPATRQTLARAESRPQAIALLLMTPEFQRR
ncbi:MAG: DUF1800 family protein [Rhodopseudomonas sp.]|nr:DUF1800 family protein [Rhodopseudomonas sp.]